jgi:serine/threonine protein kinase/WD40 repeat protein
MFVFARHFVTMPLLHRSVSTPLPDDEPTLITDRASVGNKEPPTVITGGPAPSVPAGPQEEWLDGKFRLLDQLGEGGFGLVYRAEQTQPIHRQVAVKVLKAGMDTRQVIARFDTERQTLALMEHPNIARVLDAGTTARGQPYFVMELVRGRSITRYANEKKLDLAQKLELFIPVCLAVNHAHQKGIIHRDLKPSNVMVMEEDGAPTPKVIDFGIAKVLEQKDARQTLATGLDQLVGTPGYISPEQIEFGSAHSDTRSDVYALGSILLELLTGKGLVSPMDIAHKPIHLILRDQVELDPPRPSSREPSLKGDLDWIILKALERDPARRYGHAGDLADDLRRFLHHQPVQARPPSRRYLIEKFVRRHRVGVAAGIAITFAVLAGSVTSTALYFEAERNRDLLRRSYSRSDEQMARQLTERSDYPEAVAWLCRALRTDAANTLAATNLLTLLQYVHLLHPATPELAMADAVTSARLVALSPSHRRLLAVGTAAPSVDGSRHDLLSVWNLDTLQREDQPLANGTRATALVLSPDGSLAALAHDNGRVELIDLASGRHLPLQPQLPGSALCLALSGDGQILAAGGEGGCLQFWDLRQPETPAVVLNDPALGDEPVQVVALDLFGTLAATGSPAPGGGGRALVWDLLERKATGDAFETEQSIAALALHREQEMLVVGLHSGIIHVGNFRAQSELLPPLVHPGAVLSLNLSQDGSVLHVGDGQGYLHGWDLRDGRPLHPAERHDGEIITTHLAPGAGLVTAVSRHGEVHVWDTCNGNRTRLRLPHNVAEAGLSADGSQLVAAPALQPRLQVWSIHERMTTRRWLAPETDASFAPEPPAREPPKKLADTRLLTASPSGRWHAAIGREGSVRLFDSQWQERCHFEHPPAVGTVVISEDGRLAVSSGRDQQIRFWNAVTGDPLGISIRLKNFVPSLALSPDGRRLVTLTDDGEIRVWDATTGDCLTPGIRQGLDIRRVTVSKDGSQLQFLTAAEGRFSLPMPPEPNPLPEWFLRLAEALASRRLNDEGKSQSLTPAEVRAALKAVPKAAETGDSLAFRWASWLLALPSERPLSPQDNEPLADYARRLAESSEPSALAEATRFSH